MQKILIANRGEIALRVMRTARRMGIQTIAIYSEADREAPHVRFADEAVCVGPPPSAQSYLLGKKIIQIAKDLNADGIHPGYGFLSENSAFAQAVEANGIKFIGPPPRAIEIMGNKLAAKEAVKAYQIPMVPGTDYALNDLEEAITTAKEIGFPILIKASAGGGGKGMRIVERGEDIKDQMERAISEAESAFGDGSVFIEKYITSPRHIEIQVLADEHGNLVHFFERECSIQRRHQKVIEEAPSVILTPELRRAMGQDALRVAEACGYVGAGTVEFLVDAKLNYYFLEMNTRLQVEHPVTEMITGVDLVEQQIHVARGLPLSISQDDLEINGHSLELRVYAEDPQNNFLPSIGKLTGYVPPSGTGIRVDSGFEQGMEVPIYYDPMLSKLITHGKNRGEAIARMLHAIDNFLVTGVATTLPFGKFVCLHPSFLSGQFDTHFIENYYSSDSLIEKRGKNSEIAAKLAVLFYEKHKKVVRLPGDRDDVWRNKRL